MVRIEYSGEVNQPTITAEGTWYSRMYVSRGNQLKVRFGTLQLEGLKDIAVEGLGGLGKES